MTHPGPPRFVSVGDAVELAPRDPDPSAAYRWRIERAPQGSTATLGDGAVEWLTPDEPGTYVAALRAPGGTYRQTIRCFPGPPGGESRPGGASGEDDAVPDVLGAAGERDAAEFVSADAVSEGDGPSSGRPRVRLDARLDGGALVVEADPRPNPASGETAADLDVEFVLDDRDDLDAGAATVEGRHLRVPAEDLPERARIHAVAVGERGHSVADVVELRRQETDGGAGDGGPGSSVGAPGAEDGAGVRDLGAGLTVRRPYDPPAWATDAVYYEVYVRGFAPEADEGAVFEGVADRFDHLERLGVDVLWLTPVLENDHARHGYNIADFTSIAPDLGDLDDYRRFVERAHERGFRVLFDLVLNHSARAHPHFRDAYRNPDSEYRDWYEWQESGEPGTYFDWEHIANFQFDHLPVRRHLLDVVDRWAPLVDGFRCDMAWAVPDGFWREVRDRVKARDAGFLMLDETIPYVPEFQEGLFGVHFDSTTYATLRGVGSGWEPADRLLDAVGERAGIGFPDGAGFLLYAENHDEARYLAECGEPAARAAAGALATLPGAPLVYGGQEFGQLGKRDDLVWGAADEELIEHYRRLLALRRSMPALSAAAPLTRVGAEVRRGDPERVVAFARGGERGGTGGFDGTGGTGRADSPDGADETVAALHDRIETGGDPADAPAAVVVCNFGDDPAQVVPDPPAVPVDAATGERVGTTDAVAVEDVVVLPTVSLALPDG